MARVVLGLCGWAILTACGGDDPPPRRPPDPLAGAMIFQEKCANCHTIGLGWRTGPDLHHIAKIRSRDYLLRMMTDPVTMTKTDPIAKQQLAQAKNVPMPAPNLTEGQIDDVLTFIAEESGRVTPVPPNTLAPPLPGTPVADAGTAVPPATAPAPAAQPPGPPAAPPAKAPHP